MIPSRREDGHDPKKLSDDSEQDLKSRIGSGIDGPQRDEEIVAAIWRGDLEIFFCEGNWPWQDCVWLSFLLKANRDQATI